MLLRAEPGQHVYRNSQHENPNELGCGKRVRHGISPVISPIEFDDESADGIQNAVHPEYLPVKCLAFAQPDQDSENDQSVNGKINLSGMQGYIKQAAKGGIERVLV